MKEVKSGPVVEFDLDSITDELLTYEFYTKEDLNEAWCKSVLNARSVEEFNVLSEGEEVSVFALYLDTLLADFTLVPQNEESVLADMETAKYISRGWITNIEKTHKTLQIETVDGKIKVGILSKYYPTFKDVKKNIETEARYGSCHEDAIRASLKLQDKNFLVTGYVAPFAPRDKSLHSWLEVKIDENWLVLDPSRNLIMKRDWYYDIRGIETVNRIPGETIKEEVKLLDYISDKNMSYLKLYLANRPLALKFYERLISMESEELES